jgi:voltage-gated potassium channel
VGYGDIVPDTQKGRIAGVFLMFTGIATLGLISATLASLFRISPSGATESEVPAPPDPSAARPDATALAVEVAAAREQLSALDRHLASLADVSGSSPTPFDGTG